MATTLDTYLPFDAGAGASVTEGQWRAMAERWLSDGVVAGVTNELAVAQRAAGANMSVDVATGEGRIRGHQGVSTSIKNLTVTANGSGNPRVDLVVLRADFTNNRIELDVLAGTAAAAPVEPTLTQSAAIWEIPLAAIAVSAGAASIVTADLRDRRTLTRTVTQLSVKEPVRFATTTALAASTVVGVTRTANANGAFPATDGVTAVAGDRLLDKDHGTAAQRGPWRLVELGSASRPWVMERPADFDESRDVTDGTWVVVKEGTLYAGTGWLQTANDPLTLGTTSQAWTQFPAAITVRVKDADEDYTRGGIRFIAGTGASVEIADDAGGDEVEVTIGGIAPTKATVATSQATASTSFVDLATPGPAVTVTTGTSALVFLTGYGFNDTSGFDANMGVAVSGATTIAASVDDALSWLEPDVTANDAGGRASVLVAFIGTLTPGSNTFTAKYAAGGGGSATFRRRQIVVVPL